MDIDSEGNIHKIDIEYGYDLNYDDKLKMVR